ncbi:hypothetical protein Tco_0732149 [Tanacetum coccineum]
MSGQLAEMNNIVLKLQTNISDNPKTISKLEECVRKKDFENKHRKSKVVNFTMFQNLRAQVKELKIENDGLKLLVEEITMARERVEVTLRHRDEMVSAKCKKLQLLKEQSETFYEAPSEFDSDIFYDTQDNLEKELLASYVYVYKMYNWSREHKASPRDGQGLILWSRHGRDGVCPQIVENIP